MKSRKGIFSLLLVSIIIIAYIVLYNKTYCIKVKTDDVYKIGIQTSDTYGLVTKTITNKDEIKEFMEKVRNMKFTHPKFNTGKGWVTAVDIYIKDKSGNKKIYQYTILENWINIGAYQYKIISQ